MDQTQAVDLVALLQAAYPGVDFTGPTGALYASELMAYELEDAEPAIREFIREQEWPSVAGVINVCYDARRARLQALADAKRVDMLQIQAGFVEAAPDDVRGMLDRYFESIGAVPGDRQLAYEAAHGNTDARIERARRKVAQQLVEEAKPAEGQLVPLKPPAAPRRTSCGVPWGTEGVEVNGVWCCPGCGSPLEEGCSGL